MSMDFLRSKKNSVFTIIIFGLIILTFILWGGQQAEQNSQTSLTFVNGEEIPYHDFQRMVARQMQMFGQLAGSNAKQNDYFLKLIEQRVAQDMVMRKVLAQKALSMGIQVGDKEVLSFLEKEKAFHDPKLNRFSPTVYQAVLQANDLKPRDFELSIKEDILNERIRDLIEQSLTATQTEIKDAFRIERTEFTLNSAVFDPIKLIDSKKILIPETAIKEYYESHKDEMRSSEQRHASVAILDTALISEKINVSDAEIDTFYSSRVKTGDENPLGKGRQARALHILISDTTAKGEAKAKDLIKKIKSESDFRKTAQRESEDYSNSSQGGDLGYFGEAAMVKPFSSAVFAQTNPLHKVIGPVKTDYGFHLIWILDRTDESTAMKSRKDQIRYLIRQERAQSEITKIKEQVEGLVTKGGDLTTPLQSLGFSINQFGPFDSKSKIPEFPFVIMQEALKVPADKWQKPEEAGKKLYVFKVTKIDAPQPLPLEASRMQISKRLEGQYTEKLIQELHLGLIQGKKSWEDLAKAGAQIKSSKNFKPYQATQVPDFGESDVLMKTVQRLNPKEPISSYVVHEGKWVFFRASQWTPLPEVVSETEQTRLKNDIISKKKVQVFDEFTQSLMKSAKIPKEFRAKYNI